MSTIKTTHLQHPSSGSPNLTLAADGSVSGVLYKSIAIISDEKPSNTHAGSFNNGAWRVRDLNNIVADPDGIVSLASNQFTLQAGTYTIAAVAPAVDVQTHQARIYNVTDSSIVEYGRSAIAWDNGLVQQDATVDTVFTISSAKTFELQHICELTVATYGLGFRHTAAWSAPETYSVVKIYQHS